MILAREPLTSNSQMPALKVISGNIDISPKLMKEFFRSISSVS